MCQNVFDGGCFRICLDMFVQMSGEERTRKPLPITVLKYRFGAAIEKSTGLLSTNVYLSPIRVIDVCIIITQQYAAGCDFNFYNFFLGLCACVCVEITFNTYGGVCVCV